MWISQKLNTAPPDEEGAALCKVTIGGASPGVMAERERRDVTVVTPGGFFWQPRTGETLLVLKCEGASVAVGREMGEAPVTLEAGEVYITSNGDAALHLRNDGCVNIIGRVLNNGMIFPPPSIGGV